jgi:acetyl-CoA carboxylase beta subunit
MNSDRAAAVPKAAGALYHLVADAGSLVRFGEETEVGDPADWPGYADQLRRARQAARATHAVTTGVGAVGGQPCVIVGFEFSFLGGSMGVAEGARIARAFAVAADLRLPVVSVATSGGARLQEGTSALVQMHVVAGAIAAARRAGIPHIAVAGDPTTGGVWSSLVASADVLIGVKGARVSFSGSRTRPDGADPASRQFRADGKWERGFFDAIAPAAGLRAEVATIVRLLSPRSRGEAPGRAPLPVGRDGPTPAAGPVTEAGQGTGRDAWSQLYAARTARRPRADQWLSGYFSGAFEIRGDRSGGVDTGVRCGFGTRDGQTIGYIAQAGQPTTPAGFRTATRLMTLAERFKLPVLTLIDTPGAAATPADEANGVGPAIAELLIAVASADVPVTSVIIGEGVSGGALALASPACLWVADDGYLAVTAPELAASTLKLPASAAPWLTGQLRLTPAELMSRGIVRGILQPPAAEPSPCAQPCRCLPPRRAAPRRRAFLD